MDAHPVIQGPLMQSFSYDDWMYKQLTDKNFYVGESLERLTNKQWSVFTCTPISNFEYEKFEDVFSNTLVLQGINFGKCSVTLLPELAVSEKDDPAIEIELFTENDTQIYYAIFLSRASENEKWKNFFNLPLLLCKGSCKIIRSVNTVLEKLFDNSISQRFFSQNELLILGLLTSLNHAFEEDACITLEYSYPDIEKTTVTYEINLKNFVDLWNSINETDKDFSAHDAFGLFYKELITHFRRIFGLDLSYFSLRSIKILKACIFKANGMLKTRVPETMDFLLRYLTKLTNYECKV